MYNKNNVFAKIISKEIPAKLVFENQDSLAFYDINPKAPVHILVIPKGEYTDYSDFINKASHEEVLKFFKAVDEIAKKECGNNYRLVSNIGADSGQEVFHFHMHILGGKKLGE